MGSLLPQGRPVSPHIQENIDAIRELVGDSLDIVIHEFKLGNGQRAVSFYIDGLVNKEFMGREFYAPLLAADGKDKWLVEELGQQVLSMASVSYLNDFDQVMATVYQGLAALFVEGDTQALCVEAIMWAQRSVAEPGTDVVIRGPREGFIESLRVNVSLLRRKIHHPDFRAETVRLGRYSRTDIGIVYVDSIVNHDVLAKVRERLRQIDVDAILDSGHIEQLVQDTPYSLFPTIGIAEKPDIAAARVLEGRVAVIIDGSPIVLTVPMLFFEGLHSPEDYYVRFYYASWIRVVRSIAFIINLYLPGFFLAATCYHQQLIPFKLLLSMAAAEAQTPFSIGFSLLLITLVYEILREAGVRLPKPAGQAISIVGAIVMGDAAVSANLISAPVLIVLAVTVVASFVSSAYTDASALLRMIFLLLGWWTGLFGLMIGTMVLLAYLSSLQSFGIPFFAPIAPLDTYGLKDSVLRFPMWKLKFRPRQLSPNRRRMSVDGKPGKE